MYLPFDGREQRPPKRCSGVEIVNAAHTGDKMMSVGKFMPADGTTAARYLHTAASARSVRRAASAKPMREKSKLKCPVTFISILRESHLPFSKNDYNSNRPHRNLNEAHPDKPEVRKSAR
jgi:hypothetical protein